MGLELPRTKTKIKTENPKNLIMFGLPKCGKTTKVGYSVEKDEKVRICKKCGAKLK